MKYKTRQEAEEAHSDVLSMARKEGHGNQLIRDNYHCELDRTRINHLLPNHLG